MNNFRTEDEVLEHFNLTADELHGTSVGGAPINSATGLPYTTRSWQYWRWWYGLTEHDKNVYSDLAIRI